MESKMETIMLLLGWRAEHKSGDRSNTSLKQHVRRQGASKAVRAYA